MRRKQLNKLATSALVGATSLLWMSAAVAADMKMVSVDLEGGASTIFLTPEGQSVLIDVGSPPGPATPYSTVDDSARIAAAAKKLGITRFNYLLITHYHGDHMGGVAALLEKIPVDTVIDHGPTREDTPQAKATYDTYVKAISGLKRTVAAAGDVVKVGSLTISVVASDGNLIDKPLAGGGRANPACEGSSDNDAYKKFGEENPRSVGVLLTYGVTRILSLGDLTWNKERALYCPIDKVGPVDVLVATHHGITSFMGAVLSNSPFAVAAQDPIVVLMANGAIKGGGKEVTERFMKSPGFKGLWPGHQVDGDPTPLADYTANLKGGQDGNATSVTVSDAGQITVINERNNFTQTYSARARK